MAKKRLITYIGDEGRPRLRIDLASIPSDLVCAYVVLEEPVTYIIMMEIIKMYSLDIYYAVENFMAILEINDETELQTNMVTE